MRQDVCMFFFVISLSVFVSDLEGLFLLFIVQTFRFLCSHFRKVIRIEFSPFHDFESFSSFFVASKPFFVLNHSQNAVLLLKDSGDK